MYIFDIIMISKSNSKKRSSSSYNVNLEDVKRKICRQKYGTDSCYDFMIN